MKVKKKSTAIILAATVLMSSVLAGCSQESSSSGGKLPELKPDRYELDPSTPAWQLDKRDKTAQLTWYVIYCHMHILPIDLLIFIISSGCKKRK